MDAPELWSARVEEISISDSGCMAIPDRSFINRIQAEWRPQVVFSLLRQVGRLDQLTRHQFSLSTIDLSILQDLVNLQSLYVLACAITSDLRPLSALLNLRSIDFIDCSGVSDVSGLGTLVSLQKLNLSLASVSDVSPLSTLVSLRALDLSSTLVSDISALSTLVSLQTLDLSATAVSASALPSCA